MAEILLGNIRGKDGRGLDIKGVAENIESLPTSAEVGDVWVIPTEVSSEPNEWGIAESYHTGSMFIWNGSEWKDIGVIKGEKGDKGDKGDASENADGGFNSGADSNATTGGAIGKTAQTEKGGAVGDNARAFGNGGAIGDNAREDDGGLAGGVSAYSIDGGVAAGYDSDSTGGGGAVGYKTRAKGGGAVGHQAIASTGFSGGYLASVGVTADGTNYIDAIQLGEGTNKEEKTLQVYDYQLMKADGTIPIERMPSDYRHKIVTGAYTGDSSATRKISLDFTPDIVLVFGKSGMVSFLTPQNGYRGCGGMAFKNFPCKVGDTATIEIVDGGFNVAYIAPNGDATVNVPMTNESNAQYYYMAIRQPLA